MVSELTAYEVIQMMESVMKNGTGRRMWSYGVTGEIAGKTGTTNDNADAWFIGYTPELLCGTWTGCDDRFIRFSNTAVGQGSSVALPVWAYFYKKVIDDKKLAYSNASVFAKPEFEDNEVAYDWVNQVHIPLGAQYEDEGNGNAADYSEGAYDNYQPEDIGAESNTDFDNNDYGDKPKPKTKTVKPAADTATEPKAVMPKKKPFWKKKDKDDEETSNNSENDYQ